MRKLGLLKSLVVVVLSVILVANLATVVKATSNTTFSDWDTPMVTSNNTTNTNTNTNTNANTNTNTTFTNALVNTNTTTNTNTTLNTNVNNTTNTNNAVNSLAYTGAESNTVLAVVVVIGLAVAAYSFKKVREYSKL